MGAQAKVTSKGQITLPAKLRAEFGIEPGDLIIFFRDLDNRPTFKVRRMRSGAIRPIKSWSGPPLGDEELSEGIAEAVAGDFRRADRDSRGEGEA